MFENAIDRDLKAKTPKIIKEDCQVYVSLTDHTLFLIYNEDDKTVFHPYLERGDIIKRLW